jgi:hypothetical protein
MALFARCYPRPGHASPVPVSPQFSPNLGALTAIGCAEVSEAAMGTRASRSHEIEPKAPLAPTVWTPSLTPPSDTSLG